MSRRAFLKSSTSSLLRTCWWQQGSSIPTWSRIQAAAEEEKQAKEASTKLDEENARCIYAIGPLNKQICWDVLNHLQCRYSEPRLFWH